MAELGEKTQLNLASSTETATSKGNDDAKDRRHCAYCLKVCPSPAKTCGGCKKRAYCSKECQTIDWPAGGKGQGHKNWCRKYENGEEDVDWEVVPVPGKGLGIVAKKFIPALYRIIVEPVFCNPLEHPGIMDLAPEGETLSNKFDLNGLAGDPSREGGRDYVALRISRVNHDCRPNAGHNYDDVARVEILFSQREIQPGEEICMSYRSFSNINENRDTAGVGDEEAELKMVRSLLRMKWSISCPDDCFCQDRKIHKLVSQGRKLNLRKERCADRFQVEEALECVQSLLDIQEKIGSSWISKANTHYFAFQVASMSRKHLPVADKHIRVVVDIYRAMCPYSKQTKLHEHEMEHPETGVNYLSIERYGKLRF